MTGPGTVLWSLVCSSARCRLRWSAARTWWHMCVRQSGAATRPVRDGLDPAAVIPGVCPRRGHADRDRSGWSSSWKHWPYKAWSRILCFRHFPPSPFRGDLIDLPVRELGGTSTIHLAVAGGVHIGRADGLRRRALRLQERVGYPVAESQQAGSGQCYRQGAAPPDGVG
jgi:hypothetical protein